MSKRRSGVTACAQAFNALRWLARAGASWRRLPTDLPPWPVVHQQFRRWSDADCFEAMVNDMRSIIRFAQGRQGQPSAVILDGRTLPSSCESGPRAGYDGYKRRKDSKVRMAVDTRGHLMALMVTPANGQERAQVNELCQQVQQATGDAVKLAWADQGYTGERAKRDAAQNGIELQVLKCLKQKRALCCYPGAGSRSAALPG